MTACTCGNDECARCGCERDEDGYCSFCGGLTGRDGKSAAADGHSDPSSPVPPSRPVSPHTEWGEADE